MGVTAPAIRILSEIRKTGNLPKDTLKILEFGSQDVHFYDENLYSEFFSLFGKPPLAPPQPGSWWTARQFFEQAGFEYTCVDLDGREGTLAWDLNYMQCPKEYFGSFDILTNHGTTEHLIGQYNAFSLIHDLAAVDSYIIHMLPCTGSTNHGFFSYSPVFFEGLATVNEYEIVSFLLSDLRNTIPYVPKMTFPPFSYVFVTFRKRRMTPFRVPLQVF